MIPVEPQVLFVIPTLGQRLATLERAIRSVLNQSGVTVAVVVVTPVATEALTDLTQALGVSLLIAEGHISRAVSQGFASAAPCTRYAGWIGDDDILRADSLARAVALLDENPEMALAFGDCDYIDVGGEHLFSRRPPLFARFLLKFIPGLIKQESCLFRLASVHRVGGLDETLRFAMDLDLLLRLRRIGTFGRIRAVQAGFCWHPGSITVKNREASLTEAMAIQRSAARGPIDRSVLWVSQGAIRTIIIYLDRVINQRIASSAGG